MIKIILLYIVLLLLVVGMWFGITQNRVQVTNEEDNQEEIVEEDNQEQIQDTEMPEEILNTEENQIITLKENLQAHTWIWKETQMNDGTIVVPIKADAFSLDFSKEGNLNGRTDCNGFGGSYTVENNQITFGPFISTLMYCEGSQEREFIQMVTDSTSFIFNKEGNLVLLIKYDSGSVIFTKKN